MWITLTTVFHCSTKKANLLINIARQGTVCPSGRKPTASWAEIPTNNTYDLQVDILVSLKASTYTNIVTENFRYTWRTDVILNNSGKI